jgi:hypothetical protein
VSKRHLGTSTGCAASITAPFSMDDAAQYGKVAYSFSFRRAVERGIICDYKVLVTASTTKDVNDWLRKHGESLVEPETSGPDCVEACQVANQPALVKVVEQYGISKIFTFHSTVPSARSFVRPKAEGISSHLKDPIPPERNSLRKTIVFPRKLRSGGVDRGKWGR